MKYLLALLFLLLNNHIYAEEKHWAIGGWDCRSWGTIKVIEDGHYRYAVDLDPEGKLQDWGCWQDYDQNSIVIVWMESYRIEIINRHYDKFFRQLMFEGIGIISEVEETKKILK